MTRKNKATEAEARIKTEVPDDHSLDRLSDRASQEGVSKVGRSLFSKSELMASMAFDRVTHSQLPPARHAPRKGRGQAGLGCG